jgi:hypothetical protein
VRTAEWLTAGARTRSRAALGTLLAATLAILATPGGSVAHADRRGRAGGFLHAHRRRVYAHRRRGARSASHSIRVRDEGHLHYHSVAASSILDEGAITGTIPGKGRVTFLYNGSPKVTARFSIRARAGTIYGEAHCRLHNPTSPTPSFHGALSITGGSGRYLHAHGAGHLYGVFHRHGYAISMQAIGSLTY